MLIAEERSRHVGQASPDAQPLAAPVVAGPDPAEPAPLPAAGGATNTPAAAPAAEPVPDEPKGNVP